MPRVIENPGKLIVDDVESNRVELVALTRAGTKLGADSPDSSAGAALAGYRFIGNGREPENILEQAMTLYPSGTIEVVGLQLPPNFRLRCETHGMPSSARGNTACGRAYRQPVNWVTCRRASCVMQSSPAWNRLVTTTPLQPRCW